MERKGCHLDEILYCFQCWLSTQAFCGSVVGAFGLGVKPLPTPRLWVHYPMTPLVLPFLLRLHCMEILHTWKLICKLWRILMYGESLVNGFARDSLYIDGEWPWYDLAVYILKLSEKNIVRRYLDLNLYFGELFVQAMHWLNGWFLSTQNTQICSQKSLTPNQ